MNHSKINILTLDMCIDMRHWGSPIQGPWKGLAESQTLSRPHYHQITRQMLSGLVR